MATQSIRTVFAASLIIITSLLHGQSEDNRNLPYVCLENIPLTDSLSYLTKISLSNIPTSREEDEAYGVDSIYYFQTDSLDATYLKDGSSILLASIIPKCSACVSLSDGLVLALNQDLHKVAQQSSYLKTLIGQKLDNNNFVSEDIKSMVSLEIPVRNNSKPPLLYPYWLVNLTLKQGKIKKIAILLQLE